MEKKPPVGIGCAAPMRRSSRGMRDLLLGGRYDGPGGSDCQSEPRWGARRRRRSARAPGAAERADLLPVRLGEELDGLAWAPRRESRERGNAVTAGGMCGKIPERAGRVRLLLHQGVEEGN